MTEVHVIPDERSTRRIYDTSTEAPLSEHTDVTEARLAAQARADDRDAERAVVNDRHHRTHDAAMGSTSPRQMKRPARERDAR